MIASALRKAEKNARRQFRENNRADLALTKLTIEVDNPHHRDAYSVERRPLGDDDDGVKNTGGDDHGTTHEQKEEDEDEYMLSILSKAGTSLHKRRTSKKRASTSKDNETDTGGGGVIKMKRVPNGLRFWHARSQNKMIETGNVSNSKNSSSS